MNVSIVIPVYNEAANLPACLDAIARQSVRPEEVIVVDNNSSDATLKIAARYPFVRIVTETRQGTVFARNAGFKAAKGEILCRIDADTRIPTDWVETVSRAFHDNHDVAAVTGPPEFYDAPLPRLSNAFQVLLYQRLQRLLTGTYILWGANMAIRRKAWQEAGPLCAERIGIDEDIDLSFWLHKQRRVIRYLPELPAGASLQRGRTSIRYTAGYLASWPRDYLLHRMYGRALLIALVSGGMLLICIPLLLLSRLKPKSNPAG